MAEAKTYVRVAGPSFFKADHPRDIDRYIDYFGDRGADHTADACGDGLFEDAAGTSRRRVAAGV